MTITFGRRTVKTANRLNIFAHGRESGQQGQQGGEQLARH
jgi:hypothetical protein